MKKVQDKRLALIIELTKSTGSPIEVTCRADYEVTSEGLTENRSLNVELTGAQKSALKSFGLNVVNQIKAIEA
ncbi:hypothetical protein LCGC14_2765390 [marine sediment metagenome]|uniref:Uncharacterized protein n=1 Tax=marine sediment metagenome TaxID=412755 RepID=A0A0F9BPA4_9ZZZZ